VDENTAIIISMSLFQANLSFCCHDLDSINKCQAKKKKNCDSSLNRFCLLLSGLLGQLDKTYCLLLLWIFCNTTPQMLFF